MSSEPILEREFQEALDAILNSATFERSERLKRFLGFVCQLVIAGRGKNINEHLIAIEVFERGPDYSPSEDSIVRRQAHALRKKLEEYYRGEGKDSRTRIELPLGHYAAVFRRLDEVEEIPSPKPPRAWPQRKVATLAAAAIVLFALGWFAGHRPMAPDTTVLASDISPAMRWLWRQWLNNPSGATIYLTVPRTIVVKYYPEPHPRNNTEQPIPVSSDRSHSLRKFFSLPEVGDLTEYPSVGQAKMGEAVAAIRLTSLLASHHVPVKVEQTTFLGWNDVRNNNLIVFGHSESSPWADRLIAGFPIRTRATQGSMPRRIEVSNPKPGEQAMYVIDPDKPDDLYALVSMLPGIDGEHSLLTISGLSGMATQFGAEFLTTPFHAEALATALKNAGAKTDQPAYFQAVLRVNVRDNTIPMGGKLEMVRLIDRSPGSNAVAMAGTSNTSSR